MDNVPAAVDQHTDNSGYAKEFCVRYYICFNVHCVKDLVIISDPLPTPRP